MYIPEATEVVSSTLVRINNNVLFACQNTYNQQHPLITEEALNNKLMVFLLLLTQIKYMKMIRLKILKPVATSSIII
jgi:hypothetical protein